MPDREDAARVEAAVGRVFAAAPGARAAEVRRLFVEELDFRPARGEVGLAAARDGVELPAAAERVAALEGVEVLHVALDAPANGRVRRADASEAARLIAGDLGDELLLVFTNAGASQLHLVRPDLAAARPTLRRMVVERDLPQRTAYEQIAGIYRGELETGSVPAALDRAFDVEPVTKAFFRRYESVFARAEAAVTGFADDEAGKAERRLFVQTLFNRLMFVYFLQRKGWLDFRGDKEYLRALWRDQRTSPHGPDFHTGRLQPLFFTGLNNAEPRDVTEGAASLIGDVPFLNGGLFERGPLDSREGVSVPDEAIEAVLTELFDRFNFTVMESTPFDIEVAVDPEMLGKVFEETLLRAERGEGTDDRRSSGTYYTPREVVSFMCREALKGYLDARETGLPPGVIAAFVDEQRTDGIDVAAARRVAAALGAVTVVDPACGSGAYLLGMMQELVELQSVLFNVSHDDKSLHDLKLEIIERNLHGADIDPFAVNIAMLRLWLSLTIDYEGERPRPLPNLDFKIVLGDSLLEPEPDAAQASADAPQFGLQWAPEDTRELVRLKGEYLRAFLPRDKERLRGEIDEVKARIREALGSIAPPEGALDWWVEFAEVFGGGGFDIAVANPPYRQLQRDGGRLADLYEDIGYRTFTRTGDIYQLFYERGCDLLAADGGVLGYITSNSWLRAQYGRKTRGYLAERHTPLRWLDLGKDVFDTAIVDSGVLLLRTGGKAAPFPAVDMDRVPAGVGFPPPDDEWGRIGPTPDAPWSVLSPAEQSVMGKMRATGTPLGEWDVSINSGIKTGFNDAFIIDAATRDALIATDPKSAEIVKPVLRGRDIQRFRSEWAGKWLITTHNGYGSVPAINVEAYPAVQAHLAQFDARLTVRQDQGRTPYNLRDCAYHEDFAKSKLFWMDMSPEGRFAYSEGTMFSNNSGYILTGGPLKYLLAILNSSLVTWYMNESALTSGMGLIRWVRFTVERIPVPRIGEEEQRPFVELVDRILEAKDADGDADTAEWERAIDRLVHALYGLTPDETAAVERALGRAAAGDATETRKA